MDIKPQRPLRLLRVRQDENQVPAPMPGQKTIHHRNKSSPALSTMLGAAGLKAPAKRTALGDASYAVNVQRSSKDDVNMPFKPSGLLSDKPVLVPADKKANGARKQVSRPYSVSNLRGLLTGINPNFTLEQPTKLEGVPVRSRKPVAKEPATKVYNDASLPSVRDELAQSLIAKAVSEARVSDPSDHTTESQLPAVSAPIPTNPIVPRLPPASTSDYDAAQQIPTQPSYQSSDPVESVALRSDGIFIDEQGNIRVYRGDPTELEPLPPRAEPVSRPVQPALPAPQSYGIHVPSVAPSVYPAALGSGYYPQAQQPEEYWDDEEDENYEEEGYVTARSFRSRGDTTGGVTTLIFPQVSQQAAREVEAAKLQTDAERSIEDIEDEHLDTSMVAEYGDEIFAYMRELEAKMLPNPHYMDNQAELKWSMRAVLMDWVIQVHHRFNLLPETLFLTVNYIDRFLSCKVVSLGKLQLVGATAIFIAAKYEEINCPSVQEIVYMVDGGYTIDEILKAERFMLALLQFELGWPGPMSFLRRISKADEYDIETRTLAKYFMEVTIMDAQFLGCPPSFVAAAAHCLARIMLRKGNWTQRHVAYSNYTFNQISRLLPRLVECCEQPQKHHAQVYSKYLDKRYKRASSFVEGEMARGFNLRDSAQEDLPSFAPTYFDPSAWRHM